MLDDVVLLDVVRVVAPCRCLILHHCLLDAVVLLDAIVLLVVLDVALCHSSDTATSGPIGPCLGIPWLLDAVVLLGVVPWLLDAVVLQVVVPWLLDAVVLLDVLIDTVVLRSVEGPLGRYWVLLAVVAVEDRVVVVVASAMPVEDRAAWAESNRPL